MPIYEFSCDSCHQPFESLMRPQDPVSCPHCKFNSATRLVSTFSYKWNCSPGGSTHPKHAANQEEDRRLNKRERVTKMIEKDL